MLNKIPSFADFTKNPVSVIAFMAVLALAYLYTDAKMAHNQQLLYTQEFIKKCEERERLQNEEIKLLRKDLSDLQDKFIQIVTAQKPK